MSVINAAPNLYDVRLTFKGINFTNFLSSWVYNDGNLCYIVDPGPKSVINSLKQALNSIGISKMDLNYVLLTHIHMDHAGGVGELIKFFPQAQVICHPRGIKHLINPEKLWASSLKVLGDVAKSYGEIIPVPEDRIKCQEYVADGKIKVIETLGHAPHHQSFLFGQYLFVGEAAGVNISIPENIYIRPATPPVFNYEISISSIQKLIAENLRDHMICYAHYGLRENADFLLKIAKEQLSTWVMVINELFRIKEQPDFFKQVITELKQRDKYFANIDLLDEDMREKELYFIGNCIEGIFGYVQKNRNNLRI